MAALSCQSEREPEPAPPPAAITTEAAWINLEELQQLVSEENDQVVVVNFWATWCEPCREEFPDFIRFYNRYTGRGLTLLAVSLDSPRVRDTLVKEFLAEQRPPFPVFQKTAGDDDAFINAIDPDWSGALPATFIYDRSGQRRHALYSQQSLESLENYIQPLL